MDITLLEYLFIKMMVKYYRSNGDLFNRVITQLIKHKNDEILIVNMPSDYLLAKPTVKL